MNTVLMMMPHPWRVFSLAYWDLRFHAATLITVDKIDAEKRDDYETRDGEVPQTDHMTDVCPVDPLGIPYENNSLEMGMNIFNIFEGQPVCPVSEEFQQIVENYVRHDEDHEVWCADHMEKVVEDLKKLGLQIVKQPVLKDELRCEVYLPDPSYPYKDHFEFDGEGTSIRIRERVYYDKTIKEADKLKTEIADKKEILAEEIIRQLAFYDKYTINRISIKLSIIEHSYESDQERQDKASFIKELQDKIDETFVEKSAPF